jgi:hypothetical protein
VSPMRLPDFIVGGAPRSATTWLYQALDRHPEIAMAKPVKPEPKFFLVDDLYARGTEFYSNTWFKNIPADRICGEKSTNYLESPIAAARMAKDVPHAKLIFLLRDPIERAYSNYLWSRENGMETEDFATALELEEERERTLPEKLRYARPHAYFSRGLYALMLKPYFELFPARQILCLKQDDLAADAGAFLSRVHCHLGVTPRAEDARGLGVVNANAARTQGITPEELPSKIRLILRERYLTPNRELARLIGSEFETWNTRA